MLARRTIWDDKVFLGCPPTLSPLPPEVGILMPPGQNRRSPSRSRSTPPGQ
jgi:hypothetical protein